MDIDSVAAFYQQLDKSNLHTLPNIYHQDVVFEDPAHRMHGINSLEQYFISMYRSVNSCHFDIHTAEQVGDHGYIRWLMRLSHAKLANGEPIEVEGITYVEFAEGKVIHHRDYFDLGAMLYEKLPVLGRLITAIKHKLGQS
ncbi:nuclear transport factor 2 family protein [Vibrio sp. WXL103]|uniref:nuclear transport factor 2 family protein n=1 Tax=Vibrio sp. WXL103 TaxID=3450710 RepID=UPI003EC64548